MEVGVFTDDQTSEGRRVEVSSSPFKPDGVPLYPKEIEVLPPIDAVIARGSAAVGRWLEENHRQRDWRYSSWNFRDKDIVEKYEAIEQRENPLYWQAAKLAGMRVAGPDAYARLGGWHTGWPDDDWHDLIDAKLLVHTYRDSEPWVEAWQLPSGDFKVIQRIT